MFLDFTFFTKKEFELMFEHPLSLYMIKVNKEETKEKDKKLYLPQMKQFLSFNGLTW